MNSIERRHQAVLGLLDSSRAWESSTAAALDELLRPELEDGEVMPDLELLQRLFRRALARHWRGLQAADDRCLVTAHRRRKLVARLKAARKKLGAAIAGLRAHLSDLFGRATAADHFVLRGATAEAPEELSRQAAWVVEWLCDASQPLPDGPYAPSMDDRRRWAEPVAAAAEILGPAMTRAALARKQAEAAKAERRRLRGPYEDLFVLVAGWFEATYRVAGFEDRSRAVRPSKRRKGLLLSDDPRHQPEAREPEVARLTLVEGAFGSTPIEKLETAAAPAGNRDVQSKAMT